MSIRPSVRPSVRRSGPCYFRRWKVCILGASCAVYPALLYSRFSSTVIGRVLILHKFAGLNNLLGGLALSEITWPLLTVIIVRLFRSPLVLDAPWQKLYSCFQLPPSAKVFVHLFTPTKQFSNQIILKNYMSFLICIERSFIWAQSRCSSSRRLETTCVWRWYVIFEIGENEMHWFHLEPKQIRTRSNIF